MQENGSKKLLNLNMYFRIFLTNQQLYSERDLSLSLQRIIFDLPCKTCWIKTLINFTKLFVSRLKLYIFKDLDEDECLASNLYYKGMMSWRLDGRS